MKGRAAVLAALLAGAVACRGGPPVAEAPPRPAPPAAWVHVVNDNWLDIRVSAVRNGTLFSLGPVVTCTADSFRVPSSLVGTGTVQLRADLIGSRSFFLTDPIWLDAGTHIELRIANALAQSSWVTWTEPPEER